MQNAPDEKVTTNYRTMLKTRFEIIANLKQKSDQ